QCFMCHRGDVDGLNGVGAIQLATGAPDDFLAQLETGGLLTAPISPRPSVPGTPDEQAALGYLHANCGGCHDDVHPLPRLRTMRMRIPLGLTSPLDAPAVRTTVGAYASHLIDGTNMLVVPGNALMSQVYVRMQHRGDYYDMPPNESEATDLVDTAGSTTIR